SGRPAASAVSAGAASATVPSSGPHSSPAPISSNATAEATRSPPVPPCSAGTGRPRTPSSEPSRDQTVRSCPSGDSISRRAPPSPACSAHNLRTVLRNSSCSSENVNSRTAPAPSVPVSSVPASSGSAACRPAGSATCSATRHLPPRAAGVGARLARKAEHTLGEDVAQHFGRAALDRVGPGPQETLLQGSADVRAGGVVGPVEGAFGPQQFDAVLVDPLVQLRAGQLGDRHLGAGGARGRRHPCARPVQPLRLRLDPQPGQPVPLDRGVQVGAARPQVQRVADRPRVAGAGAVADRAPLVHQRGHGDLPAVPDLPQPVAVGHPYPV